MISSDPGLRSGEYVGWFRDWFRCSERAAKDIISVLFKVGCVTAAAGTDADGRVRRYELTERGRRILGHPRGAALLRNARQLFSTCRPRRDGDRDLASLQARFERVEAFFLGARPPVRPVGCTNSILLQISTSGVATELMHPTRSSFVAGQGHTRGYLRRVSSSGPTPSVSRSSSSRPGSGYVLSPWPVTHDSNGFRIASTITTWNKPLCFERTTFNGCASATFFEGRSRSVAA
jgi:hypothetical protein